MADKKISALTAASTPLAGTEVLPIVQSGATVKVAVSDLTAGRAMAASSLTTASVQATNSGGLTLKNSGGTTQILLGAGGGDNITLSVATSVTDNLIQGTAAKGFNFTANTPAAGMTSQLLNYYEEGTWTATLTGCTTSPTVTATATRVGRVVTINIPSLSGTSNSTSKSITGMPAQYRPSNQQRGFVNLISDNGGANTPASLFVEAAGTINLFAGPNNDNWTASGTCTIQNMNLTFQYNV
jgi:hypothetical protein